MQKEVVYALSQCGSVASLKDLANAAAAVNYTMEPTGANEAYIALIKRIAANGNAKEAEKAANDLLKKATKAGATQTREAALEVLFAQQPANTNKLLQTALKDADKDYRNAALNFASAYADQALYVELMKTVMKAKPEVKVDVLNWIGRESKRPNQHDVIKNLEVRFDLPAKQVILNQLPDTNFEVCQANI